MKGNMLLRCYEFLQGEQKRAGLDGIAKSWREGRQRRSGGRGEEIHGRRVREKRREKRQNRRREGREIEVKVEGRIWEIGKIEEERIKIGDDDDDDEILFKNGAFIFS